MGKISHRNYLSATTLTESTRGSTKCPHPPVRATEFLTLFKNYWARDPSNGGNAAGALFTSRLSQAHARYHVSLRGRLAWTKKQRNHTLGTRNHNLSAVKQ